MKPSKRKLVDRLVELLERLYTEIKYSPPEEWSDVELTIPQLRTLVLLRRGSQRMSALAEYSGIGLPSATSMIDRLVDKDLVERTSDPDDRRVVTCRLTPKGMDDIDRFWRIERASILDLAQQMDTDDLEAVNHAMEILYEAGQRLQRARSPEEQSADPAFDVRKAR